jgi:hypothetical protein
MAKSDVPVDVKLLWQLWASPLSIAAVAKQLGLSRNRLYQLAAVHKLPRRKANKILKQRKADAGLDDAENEGPQKNDPTPESIAACAAVIRKSWSDTELMRRAGKSEATIAGRWSPPRYEYSVSAGTFVRN